MKVNTKKVIDAEQWYDDTLYSGDQRETLLVVNDKSSVRFAWKRCPGGTRAHPSSQMEILRFALKESVRCTQELLKRYDAMTAELAKSGLVHDGKGGWYRNNRKG